MGWPAKRGDTGHSPVGSAFFIKKGGRQNVTCRHTARPGFHAASWRLGLRGSLTQPIGAVGAYGNSVSAVAGIPRSPFRRRTRRSEEHTSEIQSLMRISYAVFCLKKKRITHTDNNT